METPAVEIITHLYIYCILSSQNSESVNDNQYSNLMMSISGYHGGGYEECRLLVYAALWLF
jgi:hypothetical protein